MVRFGTWACVLLSAGAASAEPPAMNLLLNPEFGFHSFDNSRTGQAASYSAGSVACWDQDAYGDCQAWRAPRATALRPKFPVDNVVVIHPGKRFSQFMLLAETGLDHGDHVSLSVFGRQKAPDSLQATIHLMRLDSATGEWRPKDFNLPDHYDKPFPKHSRGELVRGPSTSAKSGADPDFETRVENVEVVGAFTESADKSTDQPNTIGLTVEFTNLGKDDVWLYSPCLARGATAQNRLPVLRALPTYYRGLPRTIQKLWRGEPLHMILMGSSIDRGSANPPQYLYDEDPASPTYKQPLAAGDFDGAKIGHPELTDYYGWWQHWFSYGGRLRQALMRKYNYPVNKLLLNMMACDGSSISEAHSGFADYASLALPPEPNTNGHKSGKSWKELYPDLFARPEGPRPDLVIFGSGANEKVDGADEIALFEGAIRWFQRHYPGTEFVFCMFQNRESYTPNTGHLMELSLRYQIPFIDFGRIFDLTTRYCNSYALVPRDGHPQAAGHDLWFRQLERAFDVADPIDSGIAQLQLPDRVSPWTVGWEGDMATYAAGSPRLRQNTGFILDDSQVNLWATSKDPQVTVKLDGEENKGSRRTSFGRRDLRNSSFAVGRLPLGDRHIVEVTGAEAKLVAVDSKIDLNRQWVGVESPRWRLGSLKPATFASEWGAPYGTQQVVLPAGGSVDVEVPATDLSVAYVDQANGGTLQVEVDGASALTQPTNVAFKAADGSSLYLENRKGIRGLAFGLHTVKVTAVDGPVALLGLFTYDTRANRTHERAVRGTAMPGDVLTFSAAYAAKPLVFCTGGLQAAEVTATGVKFAGSGPGGYEVIGE